jgi:hypothetical protein
MYLKGGSNGVVLALPDSESDDRARLVYFDPDGNVLTRSEAKDLGRPISYCLKEEGAQATRAIAL